jgi:hypothetical protein
MFLMAKGVLNAAQSRLEAVFVAKAAQRAEDSRRFSSQKTSQKTRKLCV